MSDRDGCVHLLVKGNHGCGEFRFGNGAQVVTVNHDQSVRAHEEMLHTFFDAQGPVRCKLQQLVSADAASYMAATVIRSRPNTHRG